MKLVLQCAMCGTHHPVGTAVCSTCRATGVAQLRLMFECQRCGRLDLNPTCETCPQVAPAAEPVFELDDLVVAEEVGDDRIAFDLGAKDGLEDLVLELDDADEEDEKLVVSSSEDDWDDLDLDLDDASDPDDGFDDYDEEGDEFDEEEDEYEDEDEEDDY